jgi:hypothetical protein
MFRISARVSICVLASVLIWGAACAEAPQGKSGEAAAAEIAARIGDRTITMQEVDEKAMAANVKAYQALYDARRSALEQIISDLLLEEEAAAKGISKDELIDQAITQKVQLVTDADIEAFYNQNSSGLGGRTLDQMKEQIRQFLASQRVSQVRQEFFDQLKKKAEIRVSLEPPRAPVTVAANDPSLGPADAPVTIVEFSDFQ